MCSKSIVMGFIGRHLDVVAQEKLQYTQINTAKFVADSKFRFGCLAEHIDTHCLLSVGQQLTERVTTVAFD